MSNLPPGVTDQMIDGLSQDRCEECDEQHDEIEPCEDCRREHGRHDWRNCNQGEA